MHGGGAMAISFSLSVFPKLPGNFTAESPPTPNYNCLAWAVGINDQWWWPTEDNFWPEGVALNEDVETLIAAYGTLGYERAENGDHEPGIEKLALYAVGGRFTHAARQLPTGKWTSKLGHADDIEHTTPEVLESIDYGNVVAFLRRLI